MRRYRRSSIVAALTVALALSVAACAGTAPAPEASPTSALTTSAPTPAPPTAAPPTAAPSPTAAGSPTENPSASPTARLIGPLHESESYRLLAAGTHYVDDPFPVQASFTVPSGWRFWGYIPAATQINITRGPGGPGELSLEIVDNVTADPCTSELLDPPVGPSVDDLVTALSNLSEFGFEVSPATDITIDGFPGKQLTIQAPVNGPCEEMLTWRTTTRQNGVGPGEINEVRILDVDGVRLVISVAGDQSPAARSEIDAVLESIQISK